MKLKILSFTGESYSNNNVVSITILTGAGEITILEKHSPLLTHIKPSTMYLLYKDENNIEHRENFAIGKGIVEVKNSNVKIMADMLVDVADLDKSEAEKAKEEAIKLMEQYKDSKDRIDMEKFIEAEDLLLKSIAKLKLFDLK